MKTNRWRFPAALCLCVLVGVVGARIFASKRSDTPSSPEKAMAAIAKPAAAESAVNDATTPGSHASDATVRRATPVRATPERDSEPTPADAPAPMNANFRLRPFAVVKSSATHQWTAEDGLTDAAIHELAHNALEEERYKKENQWTTRRQLVYRNENVGEFVSAMETGARKQFIVPGFDGTEFVVNVNEIARFNGDGFGLQGNIEGYPGSRFQMGYAQGREAMTIEIPSRGLRYEIGPRENNEVVVSEINIPAFNRHQPRMAEPLRNDDVGRPATGPRR